MSRQRIVASACLSVLAIAASNWTAAAQPQVTRAKERSARHATVKQGEGSAVSASHWLGVQVALDRAGFSPGQIDGRAGANTSRALQGFQASRGLNATGRLDEPTVEALGERVSAPTIEYTVTEADVAGPFIAALPRDMMELAALEATSYTSPLELLAERFHVQPELLTRMNPGAKIEAGASIQVPDVEPFEVPAAKAPTSGTKAGHVIVSSASHTVRVEREGAVVFQAPVSLGSEQDPLPKGEWKITGTSVLPVFNYNPALFWDADPSHAKVKVPPGPNSPVGVVWIDLSREHLGFHGTAEPSTIGRTQSHGCLRLTNWDAMRLAALVGAGARVTLQ